MYEQSEKLRGSDEWLMSFFSLYVAKHKIKGDDERENEFLLTQVMLAFMKNYPNAGIKEVEHAFDMYEANKLTYNDETFSFYPIFNVGHCLKVFAAYQQYKTKELELESRSQKLYEITPKPIPTQNEILEMDRNFIRKAWKLSLEGKYDEFSGHFIWDRMKHYKVVTLTNEDFEKIKGNAYENILNQKIKNSLTLKISEKIKAALTNESNEVITECQKLASAYQCGKWQKEGVSLESILEQIK